MPSRVQKFNIIIVKSEITFWISITIFGCCRFFFNAYCLFDVGQNFWAFADGVRRGVTFIRARKVVLCLPCLHSRENRTNSSEISLLPRNFPLELDPKKSIVYNLQSFS